MTDIIDTARQLLGRAKEAAEAEALLNDTLWSAPGRKEARELLADSAEQGEAK